jgi:putative endonuclease
MGLFVYILRSDRDGSLYVGQTKDLATRVARHNSGRSKTYTGDRGSWTLVHYEKYLSRSEAVARERFLKSCAGAAEKRRLAGIG